MWKRNKAHGSTVAKKIEKLMPEGMHMLTWVMSDRAIPRSCGVRLLAARGRRQDRPRSWKMAHSCGSGLLRPRNRLLARSQPATFEVEMDYLGRWDSDDSLAGWLLTLLTLCLVLRLIRRNIRLAGGAGYFTALVVAQRVSGACGRRN
jgi:hypothetical protein